MNSRWVNFDLGLECDPTSTCKESGGDGSSQRGSKSREPVRLASSIPEDANGNSVRMGSYTWKASWGPKYHQSMIIALCSLALATILGFGKSKVTFPYPIESVSVAPTLTCVPSHATNVDTREQADGRTRAYRRTAGADRGSGQVRRHFV